MHKLCNKAWYNKQTIIQLLPHSSLSKFISSNKNASKLKRGCLVSVLLEQMWKGILSHTHTHTNQHSISTRHPVPWNLYFPGPLNYLVLFEHWKMTYLAHPLLKDSKALLLHYSKLHLSTQHKPQQQWMAKRYSWHKDKLGTRLRCWALLQPSHHELPEATAHKVMARLLMLMLPPLGMRDTEISSWSSIADNQTSPFWGNSFTNCTSVDKFTLNCTLPHSTYAWSTFNRHFH